MNRDLRRLLALLAALMLVVAGCGDDDEEAEEDGGTETEVTVDPALRGQTVEVMAKWTGSELDAAKQVMDAFTRKTGINVNLQGVGDDLPTILTTRVEGGNPPDIAQLPQPGLLTDLATRGALKPIDFVADAVNDRYAEIWRQLGSHEGKLYGVWFKAANKSTVWYRTKAWADNDVKAPETWDAWVAASQDLLDAGVTPLAIGAADGWVLSDWFENVYLRTAGAEKYDQLARHQIPWTDQSVVEALTTLKELIGKNEFVAGGRRAALEVTFEDSVKQVFGPDPKAATVYEGDFVANTIREETQAKAGTDYNFFPFPSVKGSDPAVVGGGDVVVMLNDKPAARELVKFLATAEAAEVWARLGGFSSPNKDVDLDAYPDDIARRAAEQVVEAETFRFDLSDTVPAAFGGTKGSGIWGRLQDWFANPDDIAGVTQRLEAEAKAATGR